MLTAAGHRAPPAGWPAGLTAREVEVLGLLARGLSNKQIAGRLVITPKTAANHVEHIYTKIGVASRAAATLSPPSTAWSGRSRPTTRPERAIGRAARPGGPLSGGISGASFIRDR